MSICQILKGVISSTPVGTIECRFDRSSYRTSWHLPRADQGIPTCDCCVGKWVKLLDLQAQGVTTQLLSCAMLRQVTLRGARAVSLLKLPQRVVPKAAQCHAPILDLCHALGSTQPSIYDIRSTINANGFVSSASLLHDERRSSNMKRTHLMHYGKLESLQTQDMTLADCELLKASAMVPEEHIETIQASSTLKKRRLKMNKHKYRKRRKRDRRRSK